MLLYLFRVAVEVRTGGDEPDVLPAAAVVPPKQDPEPLGDYVRI